MIRKISNEELFRQYYKTISKKFLDVSYLQMKEAISLCFKFVKTEMEKEDLPIIRLKYLGMFKVFVKSANRTFKTPRARSKYESKNKS